MICNFIRVSSDTQHIMKGKDQFPDRDQKWTMSMSHECMTRKLPTKHFTRSMGSAPPAESPCHSMSEPSDTEGASDSSPAPPTKRQGSPRWPQKIVIKEKVYKIRRGS